MNSTLTRLVPDGAGISPEIQEILFDRLPTGGLVIGKEGKITQVVTGITEQLLERKNLLHLGLEELLEEKEASTATGTPLVKIRELINALGENKAWFKNIRSQLPTEIRFPKYRDAVFDWKWLRFSYHPVYENHKISEILVIISDISETVCMKNDLRNHRREDEHLIQKIITFQRMDSALLNKFFLDLKDLMESFEINVLKKKSFHLYRTIHTIAGLAQTVNLKKLKSTASSIELLLLQENDAVWENQIFSEKVTSLKLEWEHLKRLQLILDKNIDKISLDFEYEAHIQMAATYGKICGNILEELGKYEKKQPTKDMEFLQKIRINIGSLHQSLYLFPLTLLEKGIRLKARDLAQSSGLVVDIQYDWSGIYISKNQVYPISEIILHLITNCFDHGIEEPKERLSLGKPGHGTIRVSATEKPETIAFTIRDDGRGIDQQELINQATAFGLGSPDYLKNLPTDKLMHLLCSPGFSMKSAQNNFNHGAGLEIVQDNIRKSGGSLVNIFSEWKRYTEVRFKIFKHISE